jgi:hypothetical protein
VGRRVSRVNYREVFFAHNGLGPFTCAFIGCWIKTPLVPWEDAPFNARLVIHHVDCDETNHAPENLVAVHFGCHRTIHGQDDATRNKQVVAARVRWSRPEERAKQGERFVGQVRSPEHAAAISAAKKGKPLSQRQLDQLAAARAKRHA